MAGKNATRESASKSLDAGDRFGLARSGKRKVCRNSHSRRVKASRSTTPCSGRQAVDPFEGSCKCGLVGKATLNGDVGKGQPGISHKISSPLHAPFRQPLIRRPAKRPFEGARKVTY